MRMRRGARALAVLATESVAIARELVALPIRAWLRAAELAGAIVLRGWRALVPRLSIVALAARGALRIAARETTPARVLFAVTICAAGVLAASQFADYRGVEIGSGRYESVEDVAAAPQVERRTPIDEHGIALLGVAAAALAATVLGAAGRPRMPRNLLILGLAVIAISLLIDAPAGLDEGRAAIAYEDARAVLEGGFWAQLLAGVVLAVCGPLLSVRLRRDGGMAGPARARGSRARIGGAAGTPIEGARP